MSWRTVFRGLSWSGETVSSKRWWLRSSVSLKPLRSVWNCRSTSAGTTFQRRIWLALREVPAGTTASYSEIADRVGSPRAARAGRARMRR